MMNDIFRAAKRSKEYLSYLYQTRLIGRGGRVSLLSSISHSHSLEGGNLG